MVPSVYVNPHAKPGFLDVSGGFWIGGRASDHQLPRLRRTMKADVWCWRSEGFRISIAMSWPCPVGPVRLPKEPAICCVDSDLIVT